MFCVCIVHDRADRLRTLAANNQPAAGWTAVLLCIKLPVSYWPAAAGVLAALHAVSWPNHLLMLFLLGWGLHKRG